MNLLEGKIAVITGASKGIGEAISRKYAENGCDLILISRDLERLTVLKKDLETNFGIQVKVNATDVTDYDAVKTYLGGLIKERILPDILVNNAGIMLNDTLQLTKPEMLKRTLDTNVAGVFYTSQIMLKAFVRKRAGSIINMSSIIGTRGNVGQSAYSASKSAVLGFTQALSKELEPLNIRVNAIAPGFIDTDMTRSLTDDQKAKNMESIGMRRIGRAEDIANTALYLASDLSTYVTGQTIGVDGGMVL